MATALTIAEPGEAGAAPALVDFDATNGNKFENDGKTMVEVFNNTTSNQVQTISITGTPTGGTFTLTYDGQTTSAIAYNADAATVQAALVALSNLASGDVVITGSNPNFTATFGGALSGTDVALLTADGSSLTGGTTPDVDIAQVTGTLTVTVETGGQLGGKAVTDDTHSIAAGARKRIGPFRPNVYNYTSGANAGNVVMTVSGTGAANLDVQAFRCG